MPLPDRGATDAGPRPEATVGQATRITLCATCALGRGGFPELLRQELAVAGLRAEVTLTDCMSGCTRPSTLSFRAAGKTAYLFGDLTDADLPDLITFAGLYGLSGDGNLSDARIIGALRMKALARIPGGETA